MYHVKIFRENNDFFFFCEIVSWRVFSALLFLEFQKLFLVILWKMLELITIFS